MLKSFKDFKKETDWCKRYPEVRDYFVYAGNIQELDVLLDETEENDEFDDIPDEVVKFFYNERKKNLMNAVKVDKSDDKDNPDLIDMKGRADGDLYSKLLPYHQNRPNM